MIRFSARFPLRRLHQQPTQQPPLVSSSHPSTVLRNVDSTARDHLANERTWLAWLRTSLTFMALSVPLHEMFRTHHLWPLHFSGAATLGVSVGVLSFATRRYYRNATLLQQGLFAYNRRGVAGLSALAFALAAGLFVVLIEAAGDKSLLLAGSKPKESKKP